ncbi:hypothetical protein MNBD_GAMMA23-601 [hydrothermal vent metagenome]|uniref:Peptidase S54 rhomboid domain-containing protein n=1 Tax=hydrothermal vent metagenome TaxID=652676 RepID=A0A3B1A0Y4_9ZZZZ
MFIPIEKKPQWQNPPILSIILILICVGAYFTWQNNDNENEALAFQYYIQSGLAKIETPAYSKYVGAKDATTINQLLTEQPQQAYRFALKKIMVDGLFLSQLDSHKIIKPSHPQFKMWLQKHTEFKRLLNRIVKYKYGLKPYQYNLQSLVIHNFLHDDISHLILNMIFLFMFGFVIELAIGRSAYLFVFLVSGIASGATLILLDPNAAYWVVGTSGAIAGLVGFYTLLYGMRKIRFFYTIIVYFGYVKAPALVLLPVWLIYELFNQYLFLDQVSNLSHIGGLLTGAALGLIYKRYPQLIHTETIQDNTQQLNFKKKFQQAIELVAQLDFNKAHKILNELLINQPNNIDVVKQLYYLEKIHPDTDQYHVFAHQLIKLAGEQSGYEKLIHRVYTEYSETAKPSAKFTPDLLYYLATLFSNNNHLDDAEKICHYLLKHDGNTDKQPELLLSLVNGLKKSNRTEQYKKYKDLLTKDFPDSKQARIVVTY